MSLCHVCNFQDPLAFTRCPQCGSRAIGDLERPHRDRTGAYDLVQAIDAPREQLGRVLTHTMFDRIADGVPLGKVILISGGPGSGKSFQARRLVIAWAALGHTIYAGYEERLEVITAKLDELAEDQPLPKNLWLTNAPFSVELAGGIGPGAIVVVDSMQTAEVGMVVEEDPDLLHGRRRSIQPKDVGPIGSRLRCLSVTEEALKLVHDAESASVVLIAHESKDDKVAGPRTVAHMVDVVMSLAFDPEDGTRSLTISKNRCGPMGKWEL